eukprot:265734-Rhodomonas_salina.2
METLGGAPLTSGRSSLSLHYTPKSNTDAPKSNARNHIPGTKCTDIVCFAVLDSAVFERLEGPLSPWFRVEGVGYTPKSNTRNRITNTCVALRCAPLVSPYAFASLSGTDLRYAAPAISLRARRAVSSTNVVQTVLAAMSEDSLLLPDQVAPYALPTECPEAYARMDEVRGAGTAIRLRACYAMSGTGIAKGSIRLYTNATRCPVLTWRMGWVPAVHMLAKMLPELHQQVAIGLSACYAMSGTDNSLTGYWPTRVLYSAEPAVQTTVQR